MADRLDLVRLLADGDYHSGETMARSLGISRAAVWKALRRLAQELGLAIESRHGRGYRLAAPLELLDPESILRVLAELGQGRIARLEVHDRIDSTNARLLAAGAAGAPAGSVCLAERQSAGRGRRGRHWVSPFGANLYLSILWRYTRCPAALGGASLAAGVAVARVLRGCGVTDLGLKWPNDLLWQRRKIGGLLLEVTGEAQGPSALVAGLGLNLRMDSEAARAIDQPWADLHQALDGQLPGRNRLAALLIDALADALARFGESGLAPFIPDWESFDCLLGEPVRLRLGECTLVGEHAGIGPDGYLRLRTPEGVRIFHAGEVSLSAPSGPDRDPE
jgi:BirA family transcriptional regulator, biotin operon repressor / biotin---[acetyl-CoA-carboxylase] ligase